MQRNGIYQEDNMENVHNQTKQLIKMAKNIQCQVPLQCIEKCEFPGVHSSKSIGKLYNVNEDICLEEFDPYWSNFLKSQKDSTANYLYNIDVYGSCKDPTDAIKNEPIPNELVRQRLLHIPTIGVLNRDNMFYLLSFILNIIRLPKERQMQWMQHFKNRKLLDNELLNYMQLIASHESSGLTTIQKDDFHGMIKELLRDSFKDFSDNYFHPEHIFRKSLMDMDPYEMAYLNDIMLSKDDLNQDEYIYLANFVHQLHGMKPEVRDQFLKYLHGKGVLPSPNFSSLIYAMGQKTKPFDEERAKILFKELAKAMNIVTKDDVTPVKQPPKREGVVITSIDIDPIRLRKSFDNLMKGGIPNIVRLNDMKNFIRDMQIFSKAELERMLTSLRDAHVLTSDQLKFLEAFIHNNNNLSLTPENRRHILAAINTVNKSRAADAASSASQQIQKLKIGDTPAAGTVVIDLTTNKLASNGKTEKKIDPNDIIHTKITDTKVPSSDVKPSDQSMKEEKSEVKAEEKFKSDQTLDKRKDELHEDHVSEEKKSKKKSVKGKNIVKKPPAGITGGDVDDGGDGGDGGAGGDVSVTGKSVVGGKANVGAKPDDSGKSGGKGSPVDDDKTAISGNAAEVGQIGVSDKTVAGGKAAIDSKAAVDSKAGTEGKVSADSEPGVDSKAGAGGKVGADGKASVDSKTGVDSKADVEGGAVEGNVADLKSAIEKSSPYKKRGKHAGKADSDKDKIDDKAKQNADVPEAGKTVTVADNDDSIATKDKSDLKKIQAEGEAAGKKAKGKKSKSDKAPLKHKEEKIIDIDSKEQKQKPEKTAEAAAVPEQKDDAQIAANIMDKPTNADDLDDKDETKSSKKGDRQMEKTASDEKHVAVVFSKQDVAVVSSQTVTSVKTDQLGQSDKDQELMDQEGLSNYGDDTKSIAGEVYTTQSSGVREIDDKLFNFVKNSQYRMHKDSEEDSREIDDVPDYSYILTTRGTTFTSVLDGQDETIFRDYRTPILRQPNVFITTSGGYKLPLIHFRMLFFHFSTRKGPSKHIVSIKNGNLILR